MNKEVSHVGKGCAIEWKENRKGKEGKGKKYFIL